MVNGIRGEWNLPRERAKPQSLLSERLRSEKEDRREKAPVTVLDLALKSRLALPPTPQMCSRDAHQGSAWRGLHGGLATLF